MDKIKWKNKKNSNIITIIIASGMMEPGVFFGMAEGLKSAEDLSSGSCSMYTTLFFPYFKLYLSEPSFIVLSIRSGLCLFFLVCFLLVLELSNMYNPRSNVPQKGELSWKSLHLRNSVESTTWTFPPEVFLCDFCCSTGFFFFYVSTSKVSIRVQTPATPFALCTFILAQRFARVRIKPPT